MEDIGEFLIPYLPSVNIPKATDRVYKDECCISFDTPYSKDGLYVCLNKFRAYGRKYVEKYHEKTGNCVFLRLRKIPIPKEEIPEKTPEESKVTKLALNVEGGFLAENQEEAKYRDENTIVILPQFLEIPIDQIEDLHSHILLSVQAIMEHDSAVVENPASWDGDKLVVSRHSENLLQLDNGVKLPPSGWKCARCDLTKNLWANLTDGTILCGRRHYDGSGGNDHALEHYRETKYPLAVKLGTITASGADVFSYDEDDMVLDSKLSEHLAHFGINMMNMEKTEKTMTELEIDVNKKLGSEWFILQESGKQLEPVYGPHRTGLNNMGNTCYLNTVVQMLGHTDEFSQVYLSKLDEILNINNQEPESDFNFQFTRLLHGLASGDHSSPPSPEKRNENSITPKMFKYLVGKGHAEFSSGHQQDAQEYLLHLFSLVEKNSRRLGRNPMSVFKYAIEERLECVQSKKVRYSNKPEYVMALPIPCEEATNKDTVQDYELNNNSDGEKPRLDVPFTACLDRYFQGEIVEDFWSPALKEKSTARITFKFATFPNYLIIQLKKFALGEDWVPKKLDVSVDMPDEIDLEKYRAKGLQEGENVLPDVDPPSVSAPPVDQAALAQLMDFGFPKVACEKALHFTTNSNVEEAMHWLLDHATDPDFETPLPNPAEPTASASSDVPEDGVAMIMSMGFTRPQAVKALKATNNNVERAADWIFSHLDELTTDNDGEGDSSSTQDASASGQSEYQDGPGKYELMGFISHMGTSTLCGHYVCHIKKDRKWIIFNDEKVAESVDPPKSLGYLYFYKRMY